VLAINRDTIVFHLHSFWDTLSIFTDSTDKDKNIPRVCRDVMRKCDRRIKRIRPSHAALYFFLAMWLIFAGSINVSWAAYQGLAPVHPFDLASARITTTYGRITHLDKLVDLSPGAFAQYQKLKTKKWLSETFPKKKEKESHCADDYFDTYEEFPVETGQYFFDVKEETDLDPSTHLCDVLNLDSIYQGRRVIDCKGTTYACEAT
jgi:hypothetical protein